MICHRVRAESAINTISGVASSASDVLSKIKAQASLIPTNYGSKDELGENVEDVINDMANTITTSIIDPLEDICLSKASILAAAKAKDDEELRRRLAAAAAAEAKAQAESNGEGVKSGTIDKPVMAYKM